MAILSIRSKIVSILLINLLLIVSKTKCQLNADQYNIGTGIADITGPAAEINMMGYAMVGQTTGGIHFRLYSRAVIIEDYKGNRVCFVSCDLNDLSQIVKLEVISAVAQKYNGIYNISNVMLSSTHTHSGPGGYLQYMLYILTSLGFVRQNFDVIVSGILSSIDRAHNSMTVGNIYVNSGQLLNASINRSPSAYLNNPQNERSKYTYDTDKDMTLLKLRASNGTDLGAITFFAVHATSMNNTNKLISGDNKGVASMLFEQSINGGTIPGQGPFVALFPNSNLGDVSPNTKGPKCLDTGMDCDIPSSTCNNNVQNCVAFGPGNDMFESTRIIGSLQYSKAKDLYETADKRLSGQIKYIHQTIDMTNVNVKLADNTTVNTCKPAMGVSFAAGTTDGPGAFPFQQSVSTSNPLWNFLSANPLINISAISDILKLCQSPKPILVPTGELNIPFQWQPHIVPTQIFQIGNIVIIAVPSEFTTMAGRRLRDAVKSQFSPDQNITAVISGLTNAYSSYVTTYEEYQVQRYEGASTIYGPHTLNAYIQQYQMLASSLISGQPVVAGPPEPNFLNQSPISIDDISLVPDVLIDTPPLFSNFGNVLVDANNAYTRGSTVSVSFVSGDPRNNLKTGSTFLAIERKNGSNWDTIATDANWETKFVWERTGILGASKVTILWDIPTNIALGIYRISHFGDYRILGPTINSYSGRSREFSII